MFSCFSDQYCKTAKDGHFSINKDTDSFNRSFLGEASEAILCNACKNNMPFWTKEVKQLRVKWPEHERR